MLHPSLTVQYKTGFIHQLTDGRFSWQSPDLKVRYVKSWRAAQIAITRYMNGLSKVGA